MDESAGFLSETPFGSEIAIADLATGRENSNMRSELLPDGLQDALFSESRFEQFLLPKGASNPHPFSYDLGDPSDSAFKIDYSGMLNTKTTTFLARSPRRPPPSPSPTGFSCYLDMVADVGQFGDVSPAALDMALSETASVATISPPLLLAGSTSGSGLPSPDSTSSVNLCAAASSIAGATGTTVQATTLLARGKTRADFISAEEYFAYQDRRTKNNTASRRSRNRSKQKVRETEDEVQGLRQENADLRKQLRIITEAFEHLRERLND